MTLAHPSTTIIIVNIEQLGGAMTDQLIGLFAEEADRRTTRRSGKRARAR